MGLGGEAGGGQNADYGDVGVEGGKIVVGFQGAVDDGGEIVEGVVLGWS
jgi:hypothetical protein